MLAGQQVLLRSGCLCGIANWSLTLFALIQSEACLLPILISQYVSMKNVNETG